MEQGDGLEFRSKYTVTAYPSLFFIDSSGKVVTQALGYRQADAFLQLGQSALKATDKSGDFVKKYEAGDHSPALLRDYAKALKQSGQDFTKIANEYIKSQTDLGTPENLNFIFDFTNYADSKLFDLLIGKKDLILKNKGQEQFEEKVKTVCNNTVKKAIEFKNEELLLEAKSKMSKNGGSEGKEFSVKADMDYYKKTGDNAKYFDACDKYAKTYLSKNAESLFKLAAEYNSSIKDPKGLKLAAGWVKKAAGMGGKYEHLFLYAQLMLKLDNKAEALKAAEQARDAAKLESVPTNAVQDFINKLKK
jgi:hypothetical protein